MGSIDEITRPREYCSPWDDLFARVVREWAEAEVMPFRRSFDEDWREHKRVGPALDRLMGGLAVQRALFPEAYGGWGLGSSDYLAATVLRVLEEVSRGDAGMGIAVAAHSWPLLSICRKPHVNERLCAEFAPLFCGTTKARRAANALTEPQGGSDIENLDLLHGSTITTTATLQGDEWVIDGHKLWPSNSGGAACLFGVACTTRPGSTDPRDFCYIFVPADRPGVTQGPPIEKAGMATDRNSDVWFEHVRVPGWYRASGPGDDLRRVREMLSFASLASLGLISGVLLNVYEILGELSTTLRHAGRPLRAHDAAASVLADVVSNLELIRIISYQYARVLDRPDLYGSADGAEVMARGRVYKTFACDRAIDSLGRAMSLLESHGVDRRADVEKHWRDLKIVQLWLGGKQLCQIEAARWFFECETL